MIPKRTYEHQVNESVVIIITGDADEKGPHIDFSIDEEWWKNNNKERRRAMFMAIATVLEKVGKKVIPEDFPDTLHA